jgi:hypothetical protein
VKPDTEYIARQLASLVLADRGDRGHLDPSGSAVVDVELRGMVTGIRQQILVDHVSLAGKIADEIERQTSKVNLDALVAENVAQEMSRIQSRLANVVSDTIDSWVQHFVSERVSKAMEMAASEMTRGLSERLYAAAYPEKKK